MTFRGGYSECPDANFFESFTAQFDRFAGIDPEDTSAKRAALEKSLGATEVELQRRRNIDSHTSERFATLLAEAYRTGAMGDPLAFLKSLPRADLEVLRKAQSLADPINPASLSVEGAYNLLLPGGYKVDFNRDGLSEIGEGRVCFFPPLDAPQKFREAWLQTTASMEEQDTLVYSLSLWVTLHGLTEDGTHLAHSAVAATPRTDLLSTYSRLIEKRLELNEHFRGFLADGQYERDAKFYKTLLGWISP